ncbi:MAG: hypothetical protein ABI120_14560 [Gemmatimonadaceae bacterium]
MSRTVPRLNSGLRAVALAAILGGQSACIRSAPVVAPSPSTNIASPFAAAFTPSTEGSNAARVVVRDYWRAFSTSVVSWADDEQWQGLRSAILRDGTVAYDHVLFYSAYAVPNVRAFQKPEWFAFSDADKYGKELIYRGMSRDVNNCQGKKGCSPYLYFAARISDEVLRNSHDSLVVRVATYGGYETTIPMRGDLIKSYLAVVDSVSAARKAQVKAGNQ